MTDALFADEMDLFSISTPKFKIDKPIRLIELFAGIGSQAKALKNLGANFEHWKVVEFDKYAMRSYNAIHGTNFDVSDIRDIHAADLEIKDTDKYCYILTYSFPCQDLSIAGAQKGMTKGSNTRSGLLWEVERILDECENLPQVLLMENVPQVIGKKNIKDFQAWRSKLEKLGYSNFVQLLNAKDYGVPQNRNRCFMVSILGNYSYQFPVKQELKVKLKDLLEENVDEKYFISNVALKSLMAKNERDIAKGNGFRFEPLDRERERERVSQLPHEQEELQKRISLSRHLFPCADTGGGREIENALTLMARDYKGIGNQMTNVVITPSVTEYKRGHGWFPGTERQVDVISTIDKSIDYQHILISTNNSKGYEAAEEGDSVNLSYPKSKTRRGRVGGGISQTIQTQTEIGVIVEHESDRDA